MKFHFDGTLKELQTLLMGIMVPIEVEEEDDETEDQPLEDPWGVVEPIIMQFLEAAPGERAAIAQYIFKDGDHSIYVRAFRALGGIYPAIRMSLTDPLPEAIQAKFRVPGCEAPTLQDVASCMIQLGSLCGLPDDLRPLPTLHEVDVSHG